MSAAARPLLIALMLAGCGGPDQSDNAMVSANSPAGVEALPPDESVATTSEELANGANEPDVGDLGNQH